MSVSIEGSTVPVLDIKIRPAAPPQGAVFSLGWVMAQLFDARRRASVTARQPPFDPEVQLPQVPDLQADPKLVFLTADLSELLHWYPALRRQAAPVRAQADRLKPAVRREAEAVAQGTAPEEPAGTQAGPAAAEPAGAEPAEAGEVAVAEETGVAARFEPEAFRAALVLLNEAILDEFADDPERLSAYQLGLALSDLVWLPYDGAAGDNAPAGKPSALIAAFSRSRIAALKTLLNGAGGQLPPAAASVVSRSLDNWADWLDVNVAKFKAPSADTWTPMGGSVLDALRVQGGVWRSVLIADSEVSAAPSLGAWVHAAAGIALSVRLMTGVVLRRFWPVVLVALAALGGLLYLVISTLSGEGQVWASLVTVFAVLGGGGVSLGSGVSNAFDGVGFEIWSAAKQDAAAWNITWLPAVVPTAMDRARMDTRGVAAPQIRKNLDVSQRS